MNARALARLRPLLQLRLRSLLVLIAFIALVLALIAQQRLAAERERQLRLEIMQWEVRQLSQETMDQFYGPRGALILGETIRADLLAVSAAKPGGECVLTPLGRSLDPTRARHFARLLLEPKIFSNLGLSDFPTPRYGLRFWHGNKSLDIVISDELAHANDPHLDLWAIDRDETGTIVEGGCWTCVEGQELADLIRDTFARAVP